jgi:hypothetical protein
MEPGPLIERVFLHATATVFKSEGKMFKLVAKSHHPFVGFRDGFHNRAYAICYTITFRLGAGSFP